MTSDVVTRCGSCHREVPAGAFCDRCGACLPDGSSWLRLRHFAAAPNQSVLRPGIAGTLFPRLTPSSRMPFQVTLAVMVALLLILAVLRMTPALISVGTLGIPLLFVLYLKECDAFREIPAQLLAVSAVLGAGLGVAGMLVTGGVVARSYDLSVMAGMAAYKLLRHGLGVPLAAALLKLVPAVVARLLSRPPREALDGFAVGALGALTFGATATLTRLTPQFAAGMTTTGRRLEGLLIEAAIYGLTVPLTAAAAGGTIGVALWFTPAPHARRTHTRRTRAGLAGLSVAVVPIFVGVGFTDIAGLAQLQVLLLHLALAFAALTILRVALQIALLHEVSSASSAQGQPCPCCRAESAGAAFCPTCGAARAAFRPVPPRVTRLRPVLGTWALGPAIVAVALIGLSIVVVDKPRLFKCPPDCARPPMGTPVTDLPRYTAPDEGFSVAYPAPGTAYDVTTDATGVTARLTVGDGGVLRLFAEPARGRPPRDIAMQLLRAHFPDAAIGYAIPNAMVGYQLGYGLTADRWPQSSTGRYTRLRILVMVAVKNDLALVAGAVGPYHPFSPDFGPGPPSGANLEIAIDMSKYVNSFRWKGDPVD